MCTEEGHVEHCDNEKQRRHPAVPQIYYNKIQSPTVITVFVEMFMMLLSYVYSNEGIYYAKCVILSFTLKTT